MIHCIWSGDVVAYLARLGFEDLGVAGEAPTCSSATDVPEACRNTARFTSQSPVEWSRSCFDLDGLAVLREVHRFLQR